MKNLNHLIPASATPRQRMAIILLAVILAAIAYTALVISADSARSRLRTSVETLRTQARQMQQDAAELAHLRAMPVATAKTDLRLVLQTQANAAGFGRALANLGAADDDKIEVTLDSVRYADWLAWVSNLQAQRVWLQTCRIEALSTPDSVRVTATFSRAASR